MQTTWPTRLYRIIERGAQVYAEPVSVTADSLDPRFTFVLDKGTQEKRLRNWTIIVHAGLMMYVWCGRKCKCVLRSKTRLFCEKINRNERKGVAEIEMVHQYLEPPHFWRDLTGTVCFEEFSFRGTNTCAQEKRPEEPIVEHVPIDFEPLRPILYQLRLGMGYLELPQLVSANVHDKQVTHTKGTARRPPVAVAAVIAWRLHSRLSLGRLSLDWQAVNASRTRRWTQTRHGGALNKLRMIEETCKCAGTSNDHTSRA